MKLLPAIATAALLTSTQVSPAQTFMSEKELLATIPGQTLDGLSNQDGKTKWAQTYSAANGRKKGIIAGNFGGEKYDAKWYVKKGQWCEDWGSGNDCWSMERVGAKNIRIYKDGKPKKNFWTVR